MNISDTFLDKIRKGNEVFSAFKTHSMQNEIASRLLDGRGRLKPFYKWKEDVRGITNHFYGPWLKTEYNTAVIRAHRAADWQHFVDEADVYPNVRWMPTTSPNQDPLHRQYWASKLTLPVNHPFWDEHHPGDRWNCKCTLRQTDEPANDSVIKDFYPIASQKGLENNPGKDGHLFSDSHSYFPKSCSSCEFYRNANKGLKNRIGLLLFNNRKKDCNQCEIIGEKINEKESIATGLKRLQYLSGSNHWKQLRKITMSKEFKPVEKGIFSAIGSSSEDYDNILFASKVLVAKGYRAYMLPNPQGFRTPDIILVKKGVYKIYDLKTISGEGSVSSRLDDSIGQSNNVILCFRVKYPYKTLCRQIKYHYENNIYSGEVKILYKGSERITLTRDNINDGLSKLLMNIFR